MCKMMHFIVMDLLMDCLSKFGNDGVTFQVTVDKHEYRLPEGQCFIYQHSN